jgi:hypothetical protein
MTVAATEPATRRTPTMRRTSRRGRRLLGPLGASDGIQLVDWPGDAEPAPRGTGGGAPPGASFDTTWLLPMINRTATLARRLPRSDVTRWTSHGALRARRSARHWHPQAPSRLQGRHRGAARASSLLARRYRVMTECHAWLHSSAWFEHHQRDHDREAEQLEPGHEEAT